MSAREKDYAAIVLGLIVAFGAHASGKPYWIDYPFMGDACDVGFISMLAFRGMFALFFSRGRK